MHYASLIIGVVLIILAVITLRPPDFVSRLLGTIAAIVAAANLLHGFGLI